MKRNVVVTRPLRIDTIANMFHLSVIYILAFGLRFQHWLERLHLPSSIYAYQSTSKDHNLIVFGF